MAIPRSDAPARADLSGHRLLVCRPQPRADWLCRELAAYGADARPLPMLEIAPLPVTGETRSRLLNLDHYQHVICVSPSAADQLLAAMDEWWPQWPVGIRWWGVGSGTAKTLRQADLDCASPVSGHNSEALLAEPALSAAALTDSRVLIVGGEGGRGLLAETLQQRARQLDSLILYRRQCPEYSKEHLNRLLGDFNPQCLITLSGETLNNLIRVVQNTDQTLLHRQLIVPVARVADDARQAGFTNVHVPSGLTADAIAACIAQAALPPSLNKDSDSRE
ncbi:MAG: uroporphyrinogen-III synthase [Halomonadaceae bacterium]|nr:MAG: uroporphyrinogen-III synthase [Halomonadaceae bacterium]